ASYSQYHPSKGYWWEFKDNEKTEKIKAKEEPGSVFQRRRVDVLLTELAKKFPPKLPSPPQLEKQTTEEAVKVEPKVEVKTEKVDTSATTVVATTTTATVTTAALGAAIVTTVNAIPPPPTTTAAASAVQRTAMKPPPEKKPRLL
ncbi:mediator of RNA polymerase II transcription subunit 6-like, partial [Stegodyphus dumicola]|uniref:mediator of RNA polymerase II transcription subunit 6-like n=1 Tax=Stegodyphus dumicola TaxID=202533 RepID=UPI0015AD077C